MSVRSRQRFRSRPPLQPAPLDSLDAVLAVAASRRHADRQDTHDVFLGQCWRVTATAVVLLVAVSAFAARAGSVSLTRPINVLAGFTALALGAMTWSAALAAVDVHRFRRDTARYGLNALGGVDRLGKVSPVALVTAASSDSDSAAAATAAAHAWLGRHLVTGAQREAFEALAPEWHGCAADLAETCRAL